MMRDATPFRSRRWKPLRRRIIARDGGVCQIRGPNCTGTADDVDHIWSWRFGPAWWFDETNLRASCQRCNRGRRAELVVAGPEVLPAHVTATAADLILADMTSGTVWLLDRDSGALRDTRGGDRLGSEGKADTDDW